MNNTGNTILKSMQKRQEAIIRHIERKKAFQIRKEEIIKDIEEARKIWANTLSQLPKQEFN